MRSSSTVPVGFAAAGVAAVDAAESGVDPVERRRRSAGRAGGGGLIGHGDRAADQSDAREGEDERKGEEATG
ncbi:hypothetical protein [Microbacterium aurum]